MLVFASNVRKSYGVDQVLLGASFRIDRREKVAMVGRNGAGKTTLLQILTKQLEPDGGSIQISPGAKIGYLTQSNPVTLGRTVLQEAQSGVEHRLELKARLSELETIMDAGDASEEVLEEFSLLHEHFMEAEGYSVEHDIKVVLQRMGFTEDEFSKTTDQLSGGEKTRLALSRLLLEEPDLLILDEPTNHLDLQATEWLEGWVRGYHGAVLLVSHDRTFLENTAERVLDMRDGIIKSFPGPFEKYLALKAEDEERLAEVARRQKIELAKMDEYVRRFMNSQRTAQARGRLKLMNRLEAQQVHAPKKDKGMKAGFASASRSGDIVIECDKLAVGFDNAGEHAVLFKDFDWTVRIGERWGVIGENGAGKSTLLKTIFGSQEPLSGKVRIGANVVPGLFTQDGVDLDPEMSPMDTLTYDHDMDPQPARDLLGRFLISGDDAYRPIKTLSGGEKNKLSLAKLTQLHPNLLVLDEPTNHLDMDSREALGQVLRDYKGTLVIVSHDRWLLSQATDHTLDIRKAGPIKFAAAYPEYRRWLERGQKPNAAEMKKQAAPPPPEPTMNPRELSKEIQRVERAVQDTEAEVSRYEGELRAIENQLANLGPTADVLTLTRDHQRIQEDLAGAIASWEELSLRLDELKALRG